MNKREPAYLLEYLQRPTRQAGRIHVVLHCLFAATTSSLFGAALYFEFVASRDPGFRPFICFCTALLVVMLWAIVAAVMIGVKLNRSDLV